MAATALVRARVDEKLKDEAAAVLADMGLTVSDVIRIVLTRVAREKALPFPLHVPNAETRAAMEEARTITRGRFATVEALIEDLERRDDETDETPTPS